MILSIAWKNIWRSKVRSLILIGTIAFALAGTIFILSMMDGWMKDRNIKLIETQLAHIQLHNPQFVNNMSITDTIADGASIIEEIKDMKFTQAVSGRIKVMGMVSSSYSSQGAIIEGVNSIRKDDVSKVYKYLSDSTSKWLDKVKRNNVVVIGRKMAKKLQLVNYQITDQSLQKLKDMGLPSDVLHKLATVKDKKFHTTTNFYNTLEKILTEKQFDEYSDLIADASHSYKIGHKIILRMQDTKGDVVEEAFRVIGVYNTNNDLFDGMYIFVKKSYLASLLGLGANTVNEIAIITDNQKKVETYKQAIKQKFPSLLVESIFDMDPTMRIMTSLVWVYYAIFEAFILFALSFGIVNTMLMAVMERTKELGMLMAIGMNRRRVFSMIMNESVLLTITGGILGIILGYLIVLYTGHVGINLTKYAQQGMEALGYSSIIYPTASPILLLETTILVIFTGVVAAIYPALKALKLKPAIALHTDV